jgi:predicted MFS family arabinose efflux permease
MGSWPLLLVGLLLVGGGTVASLAARFAAVDAGRVPADAAVAIGFVLWAATVGSIVGPNLVGLLGSLDGAGALLVLAALYGLAAVIVAAWVPASLGERSARASGRTSLRNVAGILRAHPLAVRGLGISALSHATMIALMAMAPVHLHHDSAPASVVGLVMSAHLASMYIMSPVFGRLVKRFGALRMGAAGLAVTALAAGILAVGAVGNDLVFGAGLALLGFGWSIGMVAGSTLVTQGLDPASRHASQGTTDLALNVGGGAASVIAGAIVAAAGYTALAVLVCAIATVSVLVLRPGRRPQAETLPPFSS